MPTKKFTDLPALAAPDDADVIAVEDVSVPATKQTTIAQARATLVTAAAVGAAGAVMDTDFAGATVGRLTRTGAGTYTVVRDQLAAAVAPALTDDSSAGYSVGSRWTDTTADRIYECVDASVGAAIWLPLDRIETDAAHGNRGGGALHANVIAAGAAGFMTGADKTKLDGIAASAAAVGAGVVAVGAANNDGASASGARVDHVHAHGAQTDPAMHALATAIAHGFMAAMDKDLIYERKGRYVLFQSDFIQFTNALWSAGASGAGSAVSLVAAAAATHGRLGLHTGSTATGTAHLASQINTIYTTTYTELATLVVCNLQNLADAVEDYRAQIAAVGPDGDGWCFTYDYAVSANWLLTKWAASVATHVDTGVIVDTANHRFETRFADGGAVTGYIDGVLVGTLAGVSAAASYNYVARIVKRAGTTNRQLHIDYTACHATPKNNRA